MVYPPAGRRQAGLGLTPPGPAVYAIAMLAGLKTTAAWKAARSVKRALTTPAGPPAAADCNALVEVPAPPPALEAGRDETWAVRLTNRGGVAWPAGTAVVARWASFDGTPFGEPVRTPLPRPAYPGEPVEVAVRVPTPTVVGDFVLTFDVEDFSTRCEHTKPVAMPVAVLGRRSTDIDYHAVFRTADLGQNHWWVVGAYHSQEQYERSQVERREMLEKCGLTPDSRVLDVGCGTGQMADALSGYLSDRGGYCGTDIGREAIDFCRQRFSRPNFRFAVGGMTAIPFAAADGPFDLAIFFSVFTHTYPDESALLLGQTAAALAPGGSVVADFITSPLVERHGGHRGETTVNRNHFLALAMLVGLEGEVIGRWPWNPHAERLMVRFRKIAR